MEETIMFGKLSEDVVLKIFGKLEDDPRNWARLACVCSKFSSLVRNVCWKNKCLATIPSVAADLMVSGSSEPPGGWSALHKIAVCCPGLVLSGVLLDNSDLGLHRDLGPHRDLSMNASSSSSSSSLNPVVAAVEEPAEIPGWSLYDDLYYDTVYNAEEGDLSMEVDGIGQRSSTPAADSGTCSGEAGTSSEENGVGSKRRRVVWRQMRSHMAAAGWKLSREQGGKLLHSRFRGDSLYISDWPGCVHIEDKRNYMLFRGVFKDFRSSGVWRTIRDTRRPAIDLPCAFCSATSVWDLHSTFCLRRVFGFHDDGDPVVRAYVCSLGHVSGAWTDLPLYT